MGAGSSPLHSGDTDARNRSRTRTRAPLPSPPRLGRCCLGRICHDEPACQAAGDCGTSVTPAISTLTHTITLTTFWLHANQSNSRVGASAPLSRRGIRNRHCHIPRRVHRRSANAVRGEEMPFGRRQVCRPTRCAAQKPPPCLAVSSHRSGAVRCSAGHPEKITRAAHSSGVRDKDACSGKTFGDAYHHCR